MKEEWCEEALVDRDLKWLRRNIPKDYSVDARPEGDDIVYQIFKGDNPKAVCMIYRRRKLIHLADSTLYAAIKAFGEDNGYEKMIKCWEIEEEIEKEEVT